MTVYAAPEDVPAIATGASVWWGIDPGVGGAIAAIVTAQGLDAPRVHIFDTPTVVIKKSQRTYLPGAMADILRLWSPSHYRVHVTIEAALAFGNESRPTTMKIGYGFGLWRGIIAALDLPIEAVAPAAWKRRFSFPSGAGKTLSRERAAAVFPDARADFPLVKHDGRAEALLIAEYGRHRQKN